MSEACAPSWRFVAPYPCGGERICPRARPDGGVDVGIVTTGEGRWTVDRDGEVLVDARELGRGDDGCGQAGTLIVVLDPAAPFGWHRYTAELDGGAVSVSWMAGGPGSSDVVPGLLLGLGMFAAGAWFARPPWTW